MQEPHVNAATFLQLCEANAALSDAFTSRVALSDAERAACAALSMNLQPVPSTHFDDDRALRATLPAEDRAACAAMARLLQSGALLAHLGLAATTLAAAVLLVKTSIGVAAGAFLVAALLAGAADRYYALRVRLDAGLFADLAQGHVASLPALDAALARVGLRKSGTVARSLDDRMQGAKGLLTKHVAVLGLQAMMLLGAGLS
jgi:hypothetical protein